MLGDLIVKKAKSLKLTQEEYSLAVEHLVKNGVDSWSLKFFLSLNSFGMSKKEVLYLANALKNSGHVVETNSDVFEKHSTGGIGDSVSVALIPLLASLGYKTIKTTGRSLVYTNGSSDRFCSIPGFKVDLTPKKILEVVEKTNACILSHAGDVCPADSKLFNVIEEAGLENDINLLAASIVAKKLASGAKVVLVDVKYGSASVVKTYKQAKKLAKLLKYVFEASGVAITVVITNTLQTLGEGIGNAIEVVDGLKVLQGRRCFLRRVVSRYAAEMMIDYDKSLNKAAAYDMIETALDSGKAYQKFLDIVKAQGGDVKVVQDGRLFNPYKSTNFLADKDGYVGSINALLLGELIRRLCKDTHDNNIGVVLRVKIGDYVHAGDVIISFYYKNDEDLGKYKNAIAGSIGITNKKIKRIKVIKKVIR